ncbi:MAG: Gldg family protein [Proteobacteria bacterium]|nr:Gldg family protein [Pseudomonadota bacterium]
MTRERTATPWWTSLILGIGLLFYFIGERLGGESESLHDFLAGLGLGLVAMVVATRAYAVMRTTGARRRVERTLLVAHLGTVLAIVIYYANKWTTFAKDSHAPGVLMVVFALLVVVSIVPVIVVELSLGPSMRGSFDLSRSADDDVDVEFRRVKEMAWNGLSIAFALGFLMVTCKVASDRNIQSDVSYFKTSSVGESTQNIIDNSGEPIRVLLFFPPVNEVKAQVRTYFDSIAGGAGKIIVEEHDRELEAGLSVQYKVQKDGAIVLVRGTGDKEKSQTIEIDTDIDKARKSSGKLRNLDKEVNANLRKLLRDKRKAYLVSGHGELTSPESMTPENKARFADRKTLAFKKVIGDANYETKDLGLIDLAVGVPDDATIVLLMAPTTPLLAPEWDALTRYLDRGGRLMIVLDPTAVPSMGPLEGRLGLRYNPATLTDDRLHVQMYGNLRDRHLPVTNQFSSHASTTGLSRTIDKGLLMIDSGTLEDVPFTVKGEQPKKTITVRSVESSYLDFNDDFAFSEGGLKPEKKQRYNLAAAVEGPKVAGKDGFRALVFSDVDWFSDFKIPDPRGISATLISGPMLRDALDWLGGEEVFAGDTASEDDKPIQHTKGQDAVWFTITIIGMPLVVLTLGLFGTWFRRRRPAAKTEVKS